LFDEIMQVWEDLVDYKLRMLAIKEIKKNMSSLSVHLMLRIII